ncbi:MAG: 30S ribosome-binding factor RbfA [Bacteroidaceae bacterium]|nr:30S ribosome-binding factor RbfA [Bacteroidaceae bacterium]
MEKTRQSKIARLVQKELSEMFLLQTKAMPGVLVTVSNCRVSPDLSYCNVYLSVFPSSKAQEMVDNITTNVRTVRYDLGQRLRYQLRIIPELRFFVDDTLDYIEHIDELLKK